MSKKIENSIEERIFADSKQMSLELMVNLAHLVADLYEKDLEEIPEKSIKGKEIIKELKNPGYYHKHEFFTVIKYYGLERGCKRYNFKEIAKILGLRKSQVERRKEKALKSLRMRKWIYDIIEWKEVLRLEEERKNEIEMRLERRRNSPIEIVTLGLSVKLFNALYLYGVVTIDDFLNMSPIKVLRKLHCIGKKGVEEFCSIKKELLKSSGKIVKEANEEFTISLEEIGLRTQTYEALKNSGIDTIQSFMNLTFTETINIKGIGTCGRLDEIVALREKLNRPIKY